MSGVSKIRKEIEAAIKKCGPEFTFAEVFANSNLNEHCRKVANTSFAEVAKKQLERVGVCRPARYRVAAPKPIECGDSAPRHSPPPPSSELLDRCHMGWLAEPARVGALDFLACPSLIDGKRIPRSPPVSGMVTEVSATSKSGIDARRLLF